MPRHERGHVDDAPGDQCLEGVREAGAVRQDDTNATEVDAADQHDDVEPRHRLRRDDKGEVDQEVLGQEDETPPVCAGVELDDEELPSHLEARVGEALRRHEGDPDKQPAEADDVDDHAHDADAHHALPLALEADDAEVHCQGGGVVWILGALEDEQRHGRDGPEEGEEERTKHVHEAVTLHEEVWPPNDGGNRHGTQERHHADD
mmetsp:Transcript_47688/g.147440  ORF Transcript_47688/g.147440 Transcript_47688/m.147440 type:complete len:205 (-) Transcript_47688:533-1147(-)